MIIPNDMLLFVSVPVNYCHNYNVNYFQDNPERKAEIESQIEKKEAAWIVKRGELKGDKEKFAALKDDKKWVGIQLYFYVVYQSEHKPNTHTA